MGQCRHLFCRPEEQYFEKICSSLCQNVTDMPISYLVNCILEKHLICLKCISGFFSTKTSDAPPGRLSTI